MREQMDDACMDPYVPDGTATYLDAPTVPLRKTFDGNVQDMYIAPDAMARVRRGGRLNDEVLYAGLVTFIAEDPVYSSRIATFHPFQYTNWSDGAAPRKLMRAVRRTAFHMKEVVLVPVFDREHWMLAAAHPRTGTIEFYDSLAIASWWRDHAKVRVGPAAPLLYLYRRSGLRAWSMRFFLRCKRMLCCRMKSPGPGRVSQYWCVWSAPWRETDTDRLGPRGTIQRGRLRAVGTCNSTGCYTGEAYLSDERGGHERISH